MVTDTEQSELQGRWRGRLELFLAAGGLCLMLAITLARLEARQGCAVLAMGTAVAACAYAFMASRRVPIREGSPGDRRMAVLLAGLTAILAARAALPDPAGFTVAMLLSLVLAVFHATSVWRASRERDRRHPPPWIGRQ